MRIISEMDHTGEILADSACLRDDSIHIDSEMDCIDEILADSALLRADVIAFQRPKECLLLKLPSELRNDIYTHVAIHETDQNIKSGDPPGILYVNRQLRSEFNAIYYSDQIMKAHIWYAETQVWKNIDDAEVLAAILGEELGNISSSPFDMPFFKMAVEPEQEHNPMREGSLALAYDIPECARLFQVWPRLLKPYG